MNANERGSNAASVAVFSVTMCMVGLMLGETGAALERITVELDMSPTRQGTLVASRFIGGILIGFLLWLDSSSLRIRRLVAASVLAVALSGLPLLRPTYGGALLTASIRGLAAGALIPLSGVFASSQRRWPTGFVSAIVNTSVSAGLVAVSLVSLHLSGIAGISWRAYWIAPSIVSLTILLVLPFVPFPEVGTVAEPRRRRTNWSLAAAGFLLIGSEAVLLGWMPAQSAALTAHGRPGEWFALLVMLGVLAGRVLSIYVLKRVRARHALLCSACAVIAAGIAWIVWREAAWLTILLSGLATSALFPALISTTAEVDPVGAPATITALGWTGAIGGTVVPIAAGVMLSAGVAVRWSSVAVFAPVLCALPLIFRTIRPRPSVSAD
ncbi:MAG: hypothetical protein MI724_09495 [Spirochaetales bacterium]|nr:hypothetical protein [Spirochaetales bacterium]